MSYLIEIPKDRSSHDRAHVNVIAPLVVALNF